MALSCFSQEYLSDRGWLSEGNSVSEMGLKKAQLNRNFNGEPIQLWGISYDKGIGMHANGKVVYSLHREYEWFLATIGIDDASGKEGSCYFSVFGDGRELYKSKLFRGGSGIEDIRVNIEGVDLMELNVESAGDGVENDLADWGNARVIRKAEKINWQYLGKFQSYTWNQNRIICNYPGQKIAIEFPKDNIVRITHLTAEENIPQSDVIFYDKPKVNFNIEESNDFLTITTDSLLLKLHKTPYYIEFYQRISGDLITSSTLEDYYGYADDKSVIKFKMDASGNKEAFYGGGVRFEEFNLRGKTIRNWGTYMNSPRSTGEVEVSIPMILSTNGYGILLDNSYESRFMFGSQLDGVAEYETFGGRMDYYFIAGDLKQIVKGYFDLTGYPKMPLLKSLGLHFRGRETFKKEEPGKRWDDKKYLEVVNDFRKHQIPLDAVGTEPGWSTARGNLSWSKEVFPEPEKWCEQMKQHGVLVNHWFYGQVNPVDSVLFQEMKPYINPENYPDVFSAEGMDVYYNFLKKNHFDLGISGFKEDSHTKRITTEMVFPSGKTGLELHTSYWTFWLKEIYERYKRDYNKRLNSFLASGYSGIQKYSPFIYADYLDSLGSVSRAMASTGWFGIFYGPEIQGYYIPDDGHYMRMTQIAALSPVMVHNEWMGGEFPWQRLEQVYSNYHKYVDLHYRLIPYFYSLAWQQQRKGISLIRPLPLEFQNDTTTYNIGTQYMCGPWLMVAPVWDKNQNFERRNIYFPEGSNWYDYETGEKYSGGTWLRNKQFPLDKLPLFVREGAIISQMDVLQSIGEEPLTMLILDFYPKENSSFIIYEDDGESFDYEKGFFSEVEISCRVDEKQIQIDIPVRKGKFSEMLTEMKYKLRIHLAQKTPEELIVNNQPRDYSLDNNILSFSVNEESNRTKIILKYK